MGYNLSNFKQDKFLTQFSFQYGTRLKNFIWNKVCAVSQVGKSEQRYPVVLPSDHLHPVDEQTTYNDEISAPTMIRTSTSSDSYKAIPRHLAAPIKRTELEEWEQRTGIEPFKKATRDLTYQYHLGKERDASNLLTTAANYAAGNSETLAGPDQWSDPSSDPIAKIDAAREKIRSLTGMYPNMCWMGAATLNVLKKHPAILDLTKYTGAGFPTAAIIMGFFDVPMVFIGQAIFRSTPRGVAESFSDFWGDDFGLGLLPDAELQDEDGLTDMDAIATARFFIHRPATINRYAVPMQEGSRILKIDYADDLKAVTVDSTANGKIVGGYVIKDTVL